MEPIILRLYQHLFLFMIISQLSYLPTPYDEFLYAKRSTLPNSGKGLFTKIDIPKGANITEYWGTVSSWGNADHDEGLNGYIYFINNRRVIDAKPHPDALARYANDAQGFSTMKGFSNNAVYAEIGKRVFIQATHFIPAGSEIFVRYGKEYWEVTKKNYADLEMGL